MCINLSFAPSGVIKSFCAPLNLACTGDGPSADASADGSADGSFNSFLSFLHPPKWLLESHDAPRPSPQWGSIGALVLELYESCASRDGQPNYSAGMSGQSLGAEKFKCVDDTDSTKHPQSALENPFALGVEIYNHAAPALALRPGAGRQRIKSAANPRSRSTRTMIVATSDHSIGKTGFILRGRWMTVLRLPWGRGEGRPAAAPSPDCRTLIQTECQKDGVEGGAEQSQFEPAP